MTSPRQKRDRPIGSVTLRIVFRTDREARVRIREAIPSATFHGGSCEVRIDGERPGEVAEKARAVLETIRGTARVERL